MLRKTTPFESRGRVRGGGDDQGWSRQARPIFGLGTCGPLLFVGSSTVRSTKGRGVREGFRRSSLEDMGDAAVAPQRADPPPRPPRTLVATKPPARARRSRRRPVTPRRRPAVPSWSAPAPSPSLVAASEGWLIDEWRRALRARDAAPAQELSQLLWTANRSLVERAARRLRGLPLEEARQISALALYRALERFDLSRGVPFSAYASWWFRKEGQAGQAATRFAVALPSHRLGALSAGAGARDRSLRALAGAVPLDHAGQLQHEAASPEAAVVEALSGIAVRQEVGRLSPLTQQVVTLRFGLDGGEPRSNRAVAKLLGLSDFTVRTHVGRALRTLRPRLASLAES